MATHRRIVLDMLALIRRSTALGQHVEEGEVIGRVGSTGLSTGCHLYLSLYEGGAGSDPLKCIKR